MTYECNTNYAPFSMEMQAFHMYYLKWHPIWARSIKEFVDVWFFFCIFSLSLVWSSSYQLSNGLYFEWCQFQHASAWSSYCESTFHVNWHKNNVFASAFPSNVKCKSLIFWAERIRTTKILSILFVSLIPRQQIRETKMQLPLFNSIYDGQLEYEM